MKDHAETVRNTYRKQGERTAIKRMLQKINDNPHMTTDAVVHYLMKELNLDLHSSQR